MYRIRKKFKFEGAHILSSAYSEECSRSIHGHSYCVEIFIQSRYLNEDGMVIDFKKLKEIVKPFIEAWDHQCLIFASDLPSLDEFKAAKSALGTQIVPTPWNPTAENMAKYLFHAISDHHMNGTTLQKVRVHETDTGYAEYEKG